ncbi:MAG: hypothetical protein HYS70_05230 [Nitrospinae bacterium]|nr:hypothetical protein [Nitrospinota bacterium]
MWHWIFYRENARVSPRAIFMTGGGQLSLTMSVLLCWVLFSLFPVPGAWGYGYGAGAEDPLIKGFADVVREGRAGSWDRLARVLNDLEVPLRNFKSYFGQDLRPRIEAAIQARDFQRMVKGMAHLVFLGIREKFYWNLKENLRDPAASLARLKMARRYYAEILMGNVKAFDSRHQTNLNQAILNDFELAFKALGSPGAFGVGVIPSKPEEFKSLAARIEERILQAYPYFKDGERS